MAGLKKPMPKESEGVLGKLNKITKDYLGANDYAGRDSKWNSDTYKSPASSSKKPPKKY